MKLILERNVEKFGSKNMDYGKIIIVSKDLARFVGKKIKLDVDITEVTEYIEVV